MTPWQILRYREKVRADALGLVASERANTREGWSSWGLILDLDVQTRRRSTQTKVLVIATVPSRANT